MVSFKFFNPYFAFLAIFLLAFIQASHAEDETFTQEFIRKNNDVITRLTRQNPYFVGIADGTIKDSAFIRDIIQSHHWFTLWARSAGYALTKAPVPPRKDWNLGNVAPEFFIDLIAGAINNTQSISTYLKSLALKHNFDIYGEPASAAIKADGDYMINVAKKLPLEAWLAENWVGFRFTREAYSIAQESVKKNGYQYAFQDYIDLFSDPSMKTAADQLEFLINAIYKSKKSNKKLAFKVLRQHLENDYAVYEDDL
ncbi:1404_t:CDS:1 [Acaulospora morrowiae]|uniref:1404_t:CDS:1 n=1 Tax=Acaulospora morrowiae TaxID=94023 RepID=A0A9N8Z4U8_9GLOM|nr:1404_t:CDS:1 [Acaulospora morrowiae]